VFSAHGVVVNPLSTHFANELCTLDGINVADALSLHGHQNLSDRIVKQTISPCGVKVKHTVQAGFR